MTDTDTDMIDFLEAEGMAEVLAKQFDVDGEDVRAVLSAAIERMGRMDFLSGYGE